MDLANPLIMGQVAQTSNVLPGIQDAIFGEQRRQANESALAGQARADEARKAMATLVTTPNLTPEQVNELMVPIAAHDPGAVQAYRAQQQQQADFATLLKNPNPQSIGAFMMKYPQTADGIKKAWDTMSSGQADSTLRTASDVYGHLAANDTEGALRIAKAHIEADKSAGLDTTEYEHIADLITSNPKQAQALAGAMIYSNVGAEKFAATFKAVNPTEATPQVQREYDWRVAQFGKTAADQWLSRQDTKLVPVQQGGTVYAYGPTEGGDPASGGGGAAPASDNALTFDQYKAYADVQGPEKAAAWARQNGLTISVATPAQANKLASGTRYQTPDGKVFIR